MREYIALRASLEERGREAQERLARDEQKRRLIAAIRKPGT